MELSACMLDITPAGAVVLAASDTPPHRSAGVADRLEATVLALRGHPEQPPVVVVGLDLLYPGRLVRRAVQAALPELPDANLVVGASHTHTAPMTDDTKPRLGELDRGYLDQLTETLRGLSPGDPSMPWRSVELSAGTVQTRHAINRRRRRRLVLSPRPRLGVMTLAPNPDGPTDDALSVLVARDDAGSVTFVLWSYACHPVASPWPDQVGAHFPAVVRAVLRERFADPGLPVCYLQGFSGDARPSASAPGPRSERSRRRLFTGPVFADLTPAEYQRWTHSLAGVVVDAVEGAIRAEGALSTRRLTRPSNDFVRGAAEPEVSFAALRIGDDFCLAGVSAEVVGEYAAGVRAVAQARITMTVGCLDHPFGYAPTAAMLAEGGYEAGGYSPFFEVDGVSPGVQHAVQSGFAAVLAPVDPPTGRGRPRG